nr:MAG TPA: hypothetical protein [Microviridae sp.]
MHIFSASLNALLIVVSVTIKQSLLLFAFSLNSTINVIVFIIILFLLFHVERLILLFFLTLQRCIVFSDFPNFLLFYNFS